MWKSDKLIKLFSRLLHSIYSGFLMIGIVLQKQVDYGLNFPDMIGFASLEMQKLMILCVVTLNDHEEENVGAYTGHCVAYHSPYQLFVVALLGLNGLLNILIHGMWAAIKAIWKDVYVN
ncbi:hypothetical protein LIER_39303 [Lithospermum erythrorhizon]|uniref:Uncharacterized protein n=1 Tax=Lithospermum erythrorhizon TaxID=34254 RepID=A0AAV3QCK3_LITER